MGLDREAYFFTPRYTRGQVCKALDITKDTLRYYEECGIITPAENPTNRYKYYSIADLEILNVILFLRAIDVPVQEIPRFIECKDIDTYGDFLCEEINRITDKINYWTHIKTLLTYFKETLEAYKKNPGEVKRVEAIQFRFRMAKFDYKNVELELMAPSKVSHIAAYHITKLKIVGEKWLSSNRFDTSDMIIGHLCSAEEEDDVCVHTLAKALMITTLEPIDQLATTINHLKESYKHQYEFTDRVYFVEHTFFNVFHQEALLRNIYLPINENKVF